MRAVGRGATALLLALGLAACASPVPEAVRPLPLEAPAPPPLAPAEPRPDSNPDSERDSDGEAAPSPSPDADASISGEQAAALAPALTAALESGDVAEWLALMDLSEEEEQAQRDWFAGVQAVPMDTRAVHFTGVHEEYDTAVGTIVLDVRFEHQVTGADPVPALQNYRYTLGRDDQGALQVLEVSTDGGFFGVSPQLWDLGPIVVHEAESVVVLSSAERADDAAFLLDALDVASAAALATAPELAVERLVVTMAETEELTELFGGGLDGEGDWAGFASPVPGFERLVERNGLTRTVETMDVSPVRSVLEWDYTLEEWNFHGSGTGGGSPLMRHEGMHMVQILLNPDSFAARWVIEGYAGWFEVTGDSWVRADHLDWYGVVTDGVAPTELPPAAALRFYDWDYVDRNYAESAMVFLYIEETWGTQTTLEIGTALHAVGASDAAIAPVLQEYLGLDYDSFTSDFLAWAAPQVDSW